MQTASLWGEGVQKCAWGEHFLCCSHWWLSCPCSWTARPSLRWSLMNWGLDGCHILGTSYFALQVCFCSAALLTHVHKVPEKSLGSNHEKCGEYRILSLKDEELFVVIFTIPMQLLLIQWINPRTSSGLHFNSSFFKMSGQLPNPRNNYYTILKWAVTALRSASRRKKNPVSLFETIAHYLKDLELTCSQFCEGFMSSSNHPETTEEKFSRAIAQLFKWGASRA